MNRLLTNIYGLVPKSLKQSLGQSRILKGLRRKILYTKDGFKSARVIVDRSYRGYDVIFNFIASIKAASKAKQFGIENTVLHHSISLADKFFLDRDDLTVLDVGSNFGYLAFVWADSVASKGQVFAFEPNESLFQTIRKTVEANPKFHENLEVYNLAVGTQKGIVKLNASAFSSNTEAMSSAIDTYDVEMIKLDDFVKEQELSNIDLIKIDVDGKELDILKGAETILKQQQTIVIVETNEDKEIIKYFKSLDYDIYDMNLELYNDSNQLPLNVFCVPKTKVPHVI